MNGLMELGIAGSYKRLDEGQAWEQRMLDPLSCLCPSTSNSEAYVCLAYGDKNCLTWETLDGLAETLKWLHEDDGQDCWVSLAAFDSRKRDKRHIAFLPCCSLYLRRSGSFHPSSPDEAVNLILEHCQPLDLFSQPRVPKPSLILCTGGGYYIKWLLKSPLAGSSLSLWRKLQKALHARFKDFGADVSTPDPLAMLRVPGFMNNKAHEEVRVVYHSDGRYDISELTPDLQPVGENAEAPLLEDWLNDVIAIHPASDNFVCLSLAGRGWTNRWCIARNLPNTLRKLAASPDFLKQNVYISQLEFAARKRTVNAVASMNVSFLDLDGKLAKNQTPEEWREVVLAHCRRCAIPEPNDMVFSGNGIHVKWIYTRPASRIQLERWSHIERLLFSQFEALGADAKALDAARVLRVPGTFNCKPGTADNRVRVIHYREAEYTFEEFAAKVEASIPVNAESFNQCIAELEASRKVIEPEPELSVCLAQNSDEDLKLAEADWLLNTLVQHHPRDTFVSLSCEAQSLWKPAYNLHETLRGLDFNQSWTLALSEFTEKSRVESSLGIACIPCNFVVLPHCPGTDVAEKVENVKRHCREYRDVGIPEPNQFLTVGDTVIAEWVYDKVLPGRAVSRWSRTQELLCRHFERWGAMNDLEWLKATAYLPIPGFKDRNGETVRLAYYAADVRYSFNDLATAILHFSQQEVRAYKAEKAEQQAQKGRGKKRGFWNRGDFIHIARRRYHDILHLLELRKDEWGNVREGCREKCLFWAIDFAIQAGEVTSLNFDSYAQSLIDFCGPRFRSECGVRVLTTLKRRLKDGEAVYFATDATLIRELGITEDEQREMVTLKADKQKKAQKTRIPRSQWLAEHPQERDKPWERKGISRSTYFDRKRKARKAEEERRKRREEKRREREEKERQRKGRRERAARLLETVRAHRVRKANILIRRVRINSSWTGISYIMMRANGGVSNNSLYRVRGRPDRRERGP